MCVQVRCGGHSRVVQWRQLGLHPDRGDSPQQCILVAEFLGAEGPAHAAVLMLGEEVAQGQDGGEQGGVVECAEWHWQGFSRGQHEGGGSKGWGVPAAQRALHTQLETEGCHGRSVSRCEPHSPICRAAFSDAVSLPLMVFDCKGASARMVSQLDRLQSQTEP
ncbi:hypothetical protein F751_2700 [Auxenochlorella protothecoides]|uniref:Uncharacterized protein n=1 Tax=Auxenochlorella protothecoides TaxID=3075 RepID=A0A087SL78_AUXPR|nr:hypothetical protein F751_2700 [Auxenochlorella protothecoides]KFM26482.1 hypothetical protein F751_2700 [Auxenochlorella protothecoides]